MIRRGIRQRSTQLLGDVVEQDARDTTAVSRSQNAVYVMPHDWASIAQFLGPLVDKVDAAAPDIQLLVITPDSDLAAAAAAAAVKLSEGRDVQIVAATSVGRAARLLRIRPPHIVAGSPEVLVGLLRSATLKLAAVRYVCIAWADELVIRGGAVGLETLMTELPKDAGRTVVTAELSPAVEELLERYARRARRVAVPATEGAPPTPLEYVSVAAHGRLGAVRRVLDEVDPVSAVVFARDTDSIRDVTEFLGGIGYANDESVRVGVSAAPGTALTVLFDLPASREELREAAGAAQRAIALVQPRQLASLRALAAGGAVKPYTLPESGRRARENDARMRDEVRGVLDEAKFGRELLAIEPLLDEFDGIEIAAAALQLLERERQAHRTALAALPAATRDPGNMVRLFITVGSRDNARAGDLVGAFANEGGVSSAEIGKVDVRESFSVIEVSANVADTLIEKMNGATIKGRRAVVRRDEGDRGGERKDRGDRGDRGARPPRDRGERSDRGDRGDRGKSDRPRRPTRPRT
jgi:ATP-dependent RNA helicase DeaD